MAVPFYRTCVFTCLSPVAQCFSNCMSQVISKFKINLLGGYYQHS